MYVLVFFFKQKTAYEMRISDWSSDVCSSDLLMTIKMTTQEMLREIKSAPEAGQLALALGNICTQMGFKYFALTHHVEVTRGAANEIGRASCRERVCQYV